MNDEQKLAYILEKLNELLPDYCGASEDITTLECADKLDFIYRAVVTIYGCNNSDCSKLKFVLKVSNELNYQISGSKLTLTDKMVTNPDGTQESKVFEVDSSGVETKLEDKDMLDKVYSMSESIGNVVLGSTKVNGFK